MPICNKCGCQIQPTDRFCPNCGTPVAQPVQNPAPQQSSGQQWQSQPYAPVAQASSKSSINWKVVGVVVAIVAVVAGSAYYFISKSNSEQRLWEQCRTSTDAADFEAYINDYPDGDHIADVKTMYKNLKADNELWDKTNGSTDAAAFRNYLSAFPQGVHVQEAKLMLDDAVWNDAFNRNSADALLAYLQEFPNGKHYQDAQSAYNKIQSTVMTTQDQENVRAAVEQFLSGIEAFDAQAMADACTPSVNFMGKRSTVADLRKYIDAYRNSDIHSISFSGLNIQTQKSADASGNAQFKVSFTVDRRFERDDVEKEEVFRSVEQMPTFPGGDAALMKYLNSHLQYPTMAQENGVQGTVIVQFVVTKTGAVGEAKVARSVDRDLDKEAVRLCKSLPKFVPGRQNGQPVSVWYTLPVKFKLQQ